MRYSGSYAARKIALAPKPFPWAFALFCAFVLGAAAGIFG